MQKEKKIPSYMIKNVFVLLAMLTKHTPTLKQTGYANWPLNRPPGNFTHYDLLCRIRRAWHRPSLGVRTRIRASLLISNRSASRSYTEKQIRKKQKRQKQH